jgi:hypothetical protein
MLFKLKLIVHLTTLDHSLAKVGRRQWNERAAAAAEKRVPNCDERFFVFCKTENEQTGRRATYHEKSRKNKG